MHRLPGRHHLGVGRQRLSADGLLAVRSTRASTVERESNRWPIELQREPQLDADRQWVFTDGGAHGWHAAVLLDDGRAVRRVARCLENSARNVGSELDGFILGIELGAEGARLTVVSDFLWTAYYINGWRRLTHPYLAERVETARRALAAKRFSAPCFIHHGGHDHQPTEFSHWNDAADQLCKAQLAVDVTSANPDAAHA
jgi:hypothetical protein